jgi:hypothetical protein
MARKDIPVSLPLLNPKGGGGGGGGGGGEGSRANSPAPQSNPPDSAALYRLGHDRDGVVQRDKTYLYA